jgi:hypothetical protein
LSGGSLGTKLAWAAAGLVLAVVLVAGAAGAAIASLLGGGATTPSPEALGAIPPAMLAVYQQAGATCPGLPWSVLAAIGTVESANGTSNLPGVRHGLNYAGIAAVICGCYRALWHVRHEALGGRGSLVSDGCEPRGPLDGHTGFVGCRSHDGQLSGVACGVAF